MEFPGHLLYISELKFNVIQWQSVCEHFDHLWQLNDRDITWLEKNKLKLFNQISVVGVLNVLIIYIYISIYMMYSVIVYIRIIYIIIPNKRTFFAKK